MPLDWPVDVNYHEAKAFCAWKGQGCLLLISQWSNIRVFAAGYRLLTEAEHHILRDPAPVADPV